MSELPNGWAATTIGEITEISSGFGFPKHLQGKTAGRFPFAKVGDISNSVRSKHGQLSEAENYVDDDDLAVLRARPVPAGSTVFAKIGEALKLNRRAIARADVVLDNNCMAVSPKNGIEPDFVYHYMKTIDLGPMSIATTVPSVRRGDIESIEVALPPNQEQRRIVAKLDSLRARSSRARQELDHIPKLIERYKQAILAKAFSGELTKEWREQHTKIGTGAEALAKIEDARNSLLEGRAPTRRGPVSDGEAGRFSVELPELPATWEQSSLETITSPVRLIQYGILKPGDDVSGGIPYVKVMNIQGGHVRLEKIRRTTPEIHAQYRRSAIATGDILLSIRGTVGRLAFVPPELDGGNITQDSVRIDVLPGMNARFVYWYLHSPAAQDYFAKNQKGVAVRGINVGDVRPMEIPIPSEAEQARIVTLVEHALAWLDKIATEYARAEHLLPKLDQAILAKTFRGELVPQDPNDEPASVLLERIKAERQVGGQTRGRRTCA